MVILFLLYSVEICVRCTSFHRYVQWFCYTLLPTMSCVCNPSITVNTQQHTNCICTTVYTTVSTRYKVTNRFTLYVPLCIVCIFKYHNKKHSCTQFRGPLRALIHVLKKRCKFCLREMGYVTPDLWLTSSGM